MRTNIEGIYKTLKDLYQWNRVKTKYTSILNFRFSFNGIAFFYVKVTSSALSVFKATNVSQRHANTSNESIVYSARLGGLVFAKPDSLHSE